MTRFDCERRAAGVLVPLFGLRSDRDWGVGEMLDVPRFCEWLAAAGHRWLQLLPIFEVAAGERSPYGALSAFALDPIYLALPAVEDFIAAGGAGALPAEDRAWLETVRSLPGIDYDTIRRVKRRALEIAFRHFRTSEWDTGSVRAVAFTRFRDAEREWLAEYALFRASLDEHEGRPWSTWEPSLRDRTAGGVEAARVRLARQTLFHEYVQWLAAEQWAAARRGARAAGVQLKGDLPFTVGRDSADVWARQGEFALDRSLGAPPDAFSATGQAWGLPVCRWRTMAESGFAWLRGRAARAAELFDAFRIDHVVGFYRRYVFPDDGTEAGFVPRRGRDQLVRGRRLLRVVQEASSGSSLIGEDLGVVPSFVRRSLTRLGIPGYRVLRWERDGSVFRDPAAYPALSVATSGTHDTSSLASWWCDELDDAGRRALAEVPCFAALRSAGTACTPAVLTALLDGLYAAGSALVVIPMPDAYGGAERINVPATVGPANWGYRLPWTVDELLGQGGRALREQLRSVAERHGR